MLQIHWRKWIWNANLACECQYPKHKVLDLPRARLLHTANKTSPKWVLVVNVTKLTFAHSNARQTGNHPYRHPILNQVEMEFIIAYLVRCRWGPKHKTVGKVAPPQQIQWARRHHKKLSTGIHRGSWRCQLCRCQIPHSSDIGNHAHNPHHHNLNYPNLPHIGHVAHPELDHHHLPHWFFSSHSNHSSHSFTAASVYISFHKRSPIHSGCVIHWTTIILLPPNRVE